jgi:large subunit ribosomal protein L4
MIEIPVFNPSGQQVGSVEVDEQVLGGEVRPALLKQAYVRFHANRRQGSAATKSRGQVVGSTRKLYRQKGTGNARRGAIRTNIMRGGGVAFGKKPKSWRQDMPTKMRRLANRNALLAKAVDQEIKLIDGLSFDKPSTKQFNAILSGLGIDRTCLVALADTNTSAARSARNIEDATLTQIDRLNAFDLLNHRYVLAEKQAFEDYIRKISQQAEPVTADTAAPVEAA